MVHLRGMKMAMRTTSSCGVGSSACPKPRRVAEPLDLVSARIKRRGLSRGQRVVAIIAMPNQRWHLPSLCW